MIRTERVHDYWDTYTAQHDEYRTDCYCSECGKYLGSTDFTHKVTHKNEFDRDMNFCPYCGRPLYEQQTLEVDGDD